MSTAPPTGYGAGAYGEHGYGTDPDPDPDPQPEPEEIVHHTYLAGDVALASSATAEFDLVREAAGEVDRDRLSLP